MMDYPLVDVLIPARNAADTLRETIESVRRQTLPAWRATIIDDGSTDRTAALAAELAAADPRIRVLPGPQQGVVGALNRGLGLAEAEFVARQDADDIAYPDRLARQIDYLRGSPESVAVGCSVRHIDAAGIPTGTGCVYREPDRASLTWLPAMEPYLPGPFVTVRREAASRIGGFRPMHVAEDSDFCWRLQEIGRLHNLPEILGDYRVHAASVSSRSIRHGRMMAVCSQRAALSARRRRGGGTDLVFDADIMRRQSEADTLEALCAAGGDALLAEEQRWFELAVGTKLIELSMYRPFKPEPEDCRFVARALRAGRHLLTPANLADVAREMVSIAVQLAAQGRLADAALLLPPQRGYTVAMAAGLRYGPAFLAKRLPGLARISPRRFAAAGR